MSAAADPLLLLGATSLVGRFVAPLAADQGRRTLAVSRAPPSADTLGHWLQADLAAPGLVFPRVQEVVCACPIWLLPPVLPALERAGMRRIVAVSSTSRFTKAASPHAAERAVADKLIRSEEAIAAFCEPRGIGWTVLRPTLIYAEGQDGNVSRLAGLIRRFGVLPISGRGQGRRQPVHAADLAAVALRALDAPAASDNAYDTPGGETLTYRAMAERVFEGLGRRPRILSLPPPVWSLALKLASPILRGATTAMGDRMAEDLVFDAAPAVRDLGWSPRPFRPDFRSPSRPGLLRAASS